FSLAWLCSSLWNVLPWVAESPHWVLQLSWGPNCYHQILGRVVARVNRNFTETQHQEQNLNHGFHGWRHGFSCSLFFDFSAAHGLSVTSVKSVVKLLLFELQNARAPIIASDGRSG